ncbi:MmcB family DNA repair protein [Sphingomonas colocasiae]|uniref:MmcB family DNA repair protein n=2 Tax=Sphingomonas colocasiae TaxID=1848973 RepID=A0ABS7PTP3_9SPHN|nr:MmcB family DNA repair protein [Sphingomonas colocasiae]
MSAVHMTCEPSPLPITAVDVARGVARLFLAHDMVALVEVPLGNGRRADIMALDAAGRLTIVEIKVARGDLLGDMKWPDYLDYCDRFFWAVPPGFDASPLDGEFFMPDRTGVIVADRYDGAIIREARSAPLAGARRKAETLRFARRAAGRLLGALDPDIVLPDGA